jgi:1-acyl-sn-glycerol-3-phosphate acyltransferase
MTESKRLEKALAKIEVRKKRLREEGITEPSMLGYAMRGLIAPLFRFGISLMYPRSGHVHLGNIKKKDIKRLTTGCPVVYAVAHRSILDAPRVISYAVPHSYLIVGSEKDFYCTVNEFLIDLNGVLFFDRDDRTDRRLIIERASRILASNHSIQIYPEGIENLYSRQMLKLYPGVINIALNTRATVVPVGNETHILRDKRSGRIISDINYTMYEDYSGEHLLFRPCDNDNLLTLHDQFKDLSYIDIVDDRKMECFISNGKFVCGSVFLDLDEKLQEFLTSHSKLKDFSNECTKGYLMRCAVLCEYNNMLISSLNELEKRMVALSEKINIELDKRHPITTEEREMNSREYVDYWLDVQAKVAKKGRSTAYNEIDRYINKTTDESIIESTTNKVLKGLTLLRQ